MLKKLFLATLAFASFSFLLFAQSPFYIQGKVIDKDTKDPLPAYISVKGTDVGSSADYDGTFKLSLESTDIQDPLVLEVFQLGYKKKEVEVRIGDDVLVEMELEPLPPHEVLVTADSLVAEETVQTTVALKKMDVYTLPGTAADPVYSSQVLPGVNSAPDSSSLLIRGGSPDEVLKKVNNKIQLQWLIDAYKIFPDKDSFFLKTNSFNRLAGNDVLMQQIKDGKSESEMRKSWEPALTEFKKIRKKYLLYDDFE